MNYNKPLITNNTSIHVHLHWRSYGHVFNEKQTILPKMSLLTFFPLSNWVTELVAPN